MTKRLRHEIIQAVTAGLPIGALAAITASIGVQFTEKLHATELAIAAATLCAAAAIGLSSAWFSRRIKRLAGRKRIFLSYSVADAATAEQLRGALERHGARVWSDSPALESDESQQAAVNAAIESSNTVVLVWSGPTSSTAEWELQSAAHKGVPALTLARPGAELPSSVLNNSRVIEWSSDPAELEQVTSRVLEATGTAKAQGRAQGRSSSVTEQ